MKLTIVGDPHAKNDNLEKIGEIFDLIEELGNTTIILGDLFHFKEVIRGKCLNFVFERLSQSKLEFILLVGNHDWFNLECTEHSLELFKQLPNVKVIDRQLTTPYATYLPYTHDLEKLREALAEVPANHVLFMHQGVTGFDYGNGHIAENELPLDALKNFPLVISGHFHKFQRKGNLVYPGTPFSHDFGESNQEKVIAVLDTETLELELKPTNLPQHITVEVDVDSGEPSIETRPGDIVRAVLTGSEAGIKAFDKTAHPNVKFIERPRTEKANTEAVSETDSNVQKFFSWAQDVKSLDDETIVLGMQILNEVE